MAVAALYGLIDHFQHAHVSVVFVRMNDFCHPLEKFVSAFVLVINIETRRGSGLEGGSVTNRFHFFQHLPVQYLRSLQLEHPVHHANQ